MNGGTMGKAAAAVRLDVGACMTRGGHFGNRGRTIRAVSLSIRPGNRRGGHTAARMAAGKRHDAISHQGRWRHVLGHDGTAALVRQRRAGEAATPSTARLTVCRLTS